MKYSSVLCFLFLFLFLFPLNVYAYLGPGLGAGTIGAIIGVIASVFIGIFAVVYYPIKRLLKKSGLIRTKNRSERIKGDTGVNQDEDGD